MMASFSEDLPSFPDITVRPDEVPTQCAHLLQRLQLIDAVGIASLQIQSLGGGITNLLFLAAFSTSTGSMTRLIMRLFGVGTEKFIDRDQEVVVFRHLSQVGLGPRLYAVFGNGRVEGYLPSRNLDPEEMGADLYSMLIAKRVADLHAQEIASLKPSAPEYSEWVWKKIDCFFQLIDAARFESDCGRKEKFVALNLSAMQTEMLWLKQTVIRAAATLPSSTDCLQGFRYGLDMALCHNDLLSGNVLLRSDVCEEENPITLIDYEYASYNYRAFDVANHFCEYAGFDFDIKNKFPGSAHRKAFIRNYLMQSRRKNALSYEINDHLIVGFENAVLMMTLASHLFWGTWSVVQAANATIDFDYLSYAALRFDGYHYHKLLFGDEWMQIVRKSEASSG